MKVGIIGTGHVGLPTAAALAHIGHEVAGMDSDDSKVQQLQAGELPFFEPGLESLVKQGLESGRLSFTTDPDVAVAGSDNVFLCVGTPPCASGEANFRAVEQAAQTVAEHATRRLVIVEKRLAPSRSRRPVPRSLPVRESLQP